MCICNCRHVQSVSEVLHVENCRGLAQIFFGFKLKIQLKRFVVLLLWFWLRLPGLVLSVAPWLQETFEN